MVDYLIEAREGGYTRLRLVHSGFPLGDQWDEIFDGTRRGWSYELQSLKHYLENHRGTSRRVARVRRAVHGLSNQQAWDLLWSPEGLLAEGTIEPMETGQRYGFTMPGGHRFSGRILVAIPPTDLGATVEGVENSLLRVQVDQWAAPGARLGIQIWLATWGALEEKVTPIEHSWQEMLDRMLPAEAAS